MKVEYLNHYGSDLDVVNAARVSFSKHHSEFTEGDAKLIKYLAEHNHWVPFSHPHITLRLTVPIFVARQLHKHQVGLSVSEESRRYVDTEPEFYIPDKLGKKAPSKKQGALEDEFIDILYWGWENEFVSTVSGFIDDICIDALDNYKILLENGVAPEDARMVLPLATLTSFIWTGSLAAYARVYNLRSKLDAQRQTREVAQMINDIIQPLFPYSWSALTLDSDPQSI